MIKLSESDNLAVFANYSMGNYLDGKEVKQGMTEDYDHIKFVEQIGRICKNIIFRKNPPLFDERLVVFDQHGYRMKNKYDKSGMPRWFESEYGKYVLSIVNNYQFRRLQEDKRIRFLPVVELFFDCVRRFEEPEEDKPSKKSVAFLMFLEKNIRDESERLGIKMRLYNSERAAKKNYESTVKYINTLFDIKSRIIVVRLDLSYTKDYIFNLKNDSYRDIKSHREMLIKSLPDLISVKDSVLGYIWKLEYGHEKSYHYHCMVFLDGSKIRESITVGKIIGEKWKDITKNQGIYFNCNAKMNHYKNNGIGAVDRGNTEKRESLKKAIFYITKPDCYIKAAVPDGARIFGKGEITKKMRAMRRKAKAS